MLAILVDGLGARLTAPLLATACGLANAGWLCLLSTFSFALWAATAVFAFLALGTTGGCSTSAVWLFGAGARGVDATERLPFFM